jgi:hypothetical protein
MSYVSAVAELFQQTGQPEMLTASAYTTFAEWEKEEIPLDLVKTIITERPGRQIAGFDSLADHVERTFLDWLSTPPNH